MRISHKRACLTAQQVYIILFRYKNFALKRLGNCRKIGDWILTKRLNLDKISSIDDNFYNKQPKKSLNFKFIQNKNLCNIIFNT